MFKKIVIAYDFSSFSERALEYVKKMKSSGLKQVFLVTVIEYESLSVRPVSRKLDISEYKRKTAERLQPVKESLENEGIETFIEVEYGVASKTIVEVAKRENCDLIVIGAVGSGFSNSLLGSTAQNVIKISDVPILIVPAR